jgi:ABC-type phosphate transport system substrate-binding protein
MKRALILLLSFTVMLLAAGADAATVRLVVNSSNSTPSITKAKVADLFLKRVTRWDNGRAVTPLDLSDKSAARGAFCKELLGKEVVWVKSYWQKMIFSGRATPPAELSTEAEVLDYVRNNADAIGYVADGTSLPAGVRALPVSD